METRKDTSPIGRAVADDIREQMGEDAQFRAIWEQTALLRAIAKQIIQLRIRAGISQEELAQRVGTSHSQISRIESGRHSTNVETLRRIGEALGLCLVVEFKPAVAKRTPSTKRRVGLHKRMATDTHV